MLVIDVPVKIALHTSCQTALIENLNAKGFYYLPSSKHTGVCFNPYSAANKPPYAVIVDAIIDSCEVTNLEDNAKSTSIIHVADFDHRFQIITRQYLICLINAREWNKKDLWLK